MKILLDRKLCFWLKKGFHIKSTQHPVLHNDFSGNIEFGRRERIYQLSEFLSQNVIQNIIWFHGIFSTSFDFEPFT